MSFAGCSNKEDSSTKFTKIHEAIFFILVIITAVFICMKIRVFNVIDAGSAGLFARRLLIQSKSAVVSFVDSFSIVKESGRK